MRNFPPFWSLILCCEELCGGVAPAGVVISMISAKNGDGYALLLDGSTFEEIARAKFPYGLPYGLHGCWVPKK